MPENVILCPSCSRKLRVPTKLRDRTIRCPKCNHEFRIGVASAPDAVQNRQAGGIERSNAVSPNPSARTRDDSTEQQVQPLRETENPSEIADSTTVAGGLISQNRQLIVPPDSESASGPEESAVRLPRTAGERADSEPSISATAAPEDSSGSRAENGAGLDPELAKLLPPKFILPSQASRLALVRSPNQIAVPNADGGFTTIDTSTRKIQYGGRTFEITAVSRQSKRRRRRIRSFIVVSLCAAVLLVVFYWLAQRPFR